MTNEIKITNYKSLKAAEQELEKDLIYHEERLHHNIEAIKNRFSFVRTAINIFRSPLAAGSVFGTSKIIYTVLSKIMGLIINKTIKSKTHGWKGKIVDTAKEYLYKYKDIFTNLAFNSIFRKKARREA